MATATIKRPGKGGAAPVPAQPAKALRVFQWLGFQQRGTSGKEAFGSCPLCGDTKNLYVNTENGFWSCKDGDCGRSGNPLTFVREWYRLQEEAFTASSDAEERLESLSEERGIPVSVLRRHGVIHAFLSDDNGEGWVYPVRNPEGKVCNLILWKGPGSRPLSLPGFPMTLYGLPALTDRKRVHEPVYLAEGFWDLMALEAVLEENGSPGVVAAVPGADTFKEAWAEYFAARSVTYCYDNDRAGRRGTVKAHSVLASIAKQESVIEWPDNLPERFDIRDLRMNGGTVETLDSLSVPYRGSQVEREGGSSGKDEDGEPEKPEDPTDQFPVLSFGANGRPPLEEVFRRISAAGIRLSPELKQAFRVILAVPLSNQLTGSADPLWVHIAGVPGSAKTELLTACKRVRNCVFRSTLTAHGLVSGFMLQGGKDPSLIPQLIGKTFVLKDWTEVIKMNKTSRDEIHSILRGAYDGSVEKSFGNGLLRVYTGHFSMVTGVTHTIFGETGAVLGERFLIFKLTGDETLEEQDDTLKTVIRNVGKEKVIKEELLSAVAEFLEWKIPPELIPVVPDEYIDRLVGLSQLTAYLRANVERRGISSESAVAYRPSPERGTRLAKQLTKLLVSLGLQNNPPAIGDEEYAVVLRVALNSCIGWNLDALQELARKDGRGLTDLSETCRIPYNTLRDQLNDMALLGVLRKEYVPNKRERGALRAVYWLSPAVARYWQMAGLPFGNGSPAPGSQELARRLLAGSKLKARVRSVGANGRNGRGTR